MEDGSLLQALGPTWLPFRFSHRIMSRFMIGLYKQSRSMLMRSGNRVLFCIASAIFYGVFLYTLGSGMLRQSGHVLCIAKAEFCLTAVDTQRNAGPVRISSPSGQATELRVGTRF
ncbi:hypothetical protein M758_8G192200 [Ceratodon purpureus]|nr:hypothetical protein M758_8G192200 [Ceratodon purpureus]